MTRIEPIRSSMALVGPVRASAQTGSRDRREHPGQDRRERRRAKPARVSLGAATEQAAFDLHQIANGGPRGLKADMAVRQTWSNAYAQAAAPAAPGSCRRALA